MRAGRLRREQQWLLVALLAVCAAMLVGMLVWSGAADAALEHPYIGSFAKNKKGFSDEVCGASIDPASGEIAVADPGASVPSLEVFSEAGTFLRRIASVQIPEEELKEEKLEREEKEKKEIEKGKTPKEPAGKFEKEELEEFCSTAVNDNNGYLYIADGGEHAIYPFDKEGKQVFKTNGEGKRIAGAEITGAATPAGAFSEELKIAIDEKTGRLYVSDIGNGAVDIFSEGGAYEGQVVLPGSEVLPEAITVDQVTGELYVAAHGQALDEEENDGFGFVYVFDSSGKLLREIGGRSSGAFPGFGNETEPLLTGIALGPEGNLYVDDLPRRAVFEFDSSGAYLGEILGTPSEPFDEPLSVALDKTGDLYVVDRTEGISTERRQAESGLSEVPGLVAEFGPAGTSGPPTVESESVSGVTATGATLHAGIDPTGVDTSYHFELCQDSSCTSVPASSVEVGSGEAIEEVAQPVSGLQANTIYSYRVVLTYGAGGASTVDGAVETFTTKTEGAGVQLPDGRAWELVSSPEKNGAGLESIPREGGLIQASEDGSALTYISLAPDEPKAQGNRVPTFVQLLAKRGHNATTGLPDWTGEDITLPGADKATGARTGNGKQEYRYFSSDLAVSLVEPIGNSAKAEPKLYPGDTERSLYTRQTEGCEAPPSACYTPVVSSSNDVSGEPFGGTEGNKRGLEFVNATPDLSHVVFKSLVQLNEEAESSKEIDYEWAAREPDGKDIPASEQLKLIGILPKLTASEAPQPAPEAELGYKHLTRQAISSDGSRVIFSSDGHLYTRDMATNETQQADTSYAGVEAGSAIFQTASSDGLKIFFTDEAKLTEKSTASTRNSDLYEYDVETKKVIDLSVDPHLKETGERAAVQGLVPGASEDGSTIYFVANGVLTTTPNGHGETAAAGHCAKKIQQGEVPAGATCNVYAEQVGEEGATPTFVARLSYEDLPDWENNNENLAYVTSRVSPNGQFFAFMSNRRLTNYDNRDTNPEAHEAADEEVFVYDSATGSLTCTSCDPSAGRPSGVFDGGELVRGEEGLGLLIDRIETWEGKWLAGALPGWTASEGQTATYQSRYLSDSGRLFFDTTAPLSQADTNGKTDVYEFEPNEVGSCATQAGCTDLISSGSSTHESAFLDASTSGDDVFFLSASALVPGDRDNDFDVYDARVCGAAGCVSESSSEAGSCNSTAECRPAETVISSFGTPASVTTPSSGNLAPQGAVLPSKVVQKPTVKKLTRAQQLAKALKACKKLKKKAKRAACEKTARKRYGPKKKAKKASSHKTGRAK